MPTPIRALPALGDGLTLRSRRLASSEGRCACRPARGVMAPRVSELATYRRRSAGSAGEGERIDRDADDGRALEE